MAHVRKVIYEVAELALAGGESASLTHGEAREVMKIGLQAVRITKKVAGEHDFIVVHNTWNPDALKSIIARMERSLEYKKASKLLQMMEQMAALIGGAHKKSSRNAEGAIQGLPPKKQLGKEIRNKRNADEIVNEEGEGDESGKPKKKRIKRTEAGVP